jgi:hypothetical protein
MLSNGQPIDILIGIVRRSPVRPQDIRNSCPLLNLAQEMSPLDEQFRKRLERLFLAWQKELLRFCGGGSPKDGAPRTES